MSHITVTKVEMPESVRRAIQRAFDDAKRQPRTSVMARAWWHARDWRRLWQQAWWNSK